MAVAGNFYHFNTLEKCQIKDWQNDNIDLGMYEINTIADGKCFVWY